MTFQVGEDCLPVEIPILEDCLSEGTETFTVWIESNDPDVKAGGPATVIVVDGFSKCASDSL